MTRYELLQKKIELIRRTEYDCTIRGKVEMARDWSNLRAQLEREAKEMPTEKAKEIVG
jgi:hypothetical protein